MKFVSQMHYKSAIVAAFSLPFLLGKAMLLCDRDERGAFDVDVVGRTGHDIWRFRNHRLGERRNLDDVLRIARCHWGKSRSALIRRQRG